MPKKIRESLDGEIHGKLKGMLANSRQGLGMRGSVFCNYNDGKEVFRVS